MVGLGLAIAGTGTAHADQVPLPSEVSVALTNFSADPQTALATWSSWAAASPMTYVRKGKRPKTRSNCRIDAAGVAACNDFAQVVGRGNRNMGMKRISEIVTAGDRQYFRDPPLKRWTKTRAVTNPNPVTGISQRVGFNPWLPWNDGAADITITVLSNGSYEVSSRNPDPSGDEVARAVVRIAANGTQATVLEYDSKDRLSNTTRITFETVGTVRIPKG